MDKANAFLDRIPALWRHAAIVFGGTFAGTILNAIIDAKGVLGVPWVPTLTTGLDSAAYATAVAIVALWLTPLTRQYGIGKAKAK